MVVAAATVVVVVVVLVLLVAAAAVATAVVVVAVAWVDFSVRAAAPCRTRTTHPDAAGVATAPAIAGGNVLAENTVALFLSLSLLFPFSLSLAALAHHALPAASENSIRRPRM